MYSISGGIDDNGERYVVTFDFDDKVFMKLKGKIPNTAFEKLLLREDKRTIVKFSDNAFLVNIDCKIGEELQENEAEIFLPLIVNIFFKLN